MGGAPIELLGTNDDTLHFLLRAAAEAGPTAPDVLSGSTIVLRHADVEALAHDPRLAGVGLSLFDLMEVPEGPLRTWYGRLMFTNEGDTHKRLRSLVSRAFTPRAVEALRGEAARSASQAFGRIVADGGGDLTERTALVPMDVMASLLGVPHEDVGSVARWTEALSPTFGIMSPEEIEAASDAIVGLLAYMEQLTERRRADPADDLISKLLEVEDQGDRLDHHELLDMVANLLVGGHDTTASQIGCTLLTLLRHPHAVTRLRSEPDLLPSAVAETIRFEPSIGVVPRTTTEPMTVADVEVDAGAGLLLSTAAANREPGVWTDPDVLEIDRFTRSDVPRLLSFGAGVHYCLGAALARLTVEEVVRAFVAVEPGLELAVRSDEVEWRSILGRSPARLPVLVA